MYLLSIFQPSLVRYTSWSFLFTMFVLIVLLQIYFYKKTGVFLEKAIQSEDKIRRWRKVLIAWLAIINLPYLGIVLFVGDWIAFGPNGLTAKLVAWIMYPFYVWEFGLAMFFAINLAKTITLDIVNLARKLFRREKGIVTQEPVSLSRRQLLNGLTVGVGALPFATVAYGIVMAENFYEIERVRIPIRNLPPQFEGFRIMQLTDIHAGLFMTQARMSDFARAANALQPDLIALTGDYVATSRDSIKPFMNAFGELRAHHGVFGVLGNHDVFTDSTSRLIREFSARGFKFMVNEQEWIKRDGARLNLLGIEFLPQTEIDLERTLRGLPLDGPSVLLSHQPNALAKASQRNIDLTLSGHLHGGQMKLEFLGLDVAPTKIVSPYISGVYKHGDAQMYLSRGLGTTAVPIRLNARPEITEITLFRDPNS